MRRLTVEGDADGDAFRAGRELDLALAIAEGVFDPFVLDVPVMLSPQPFVTHNGHRPRCGFMPSVYK